MIFWRVAQRWRPVRLHLAAGLEVLSTRIGLGGDVSGEEKTIGFALVGIGSLSMGQLLPAFAKCKVAQPVALVSGHPDKAQQQAAKYGIDPKNIYNYENFDSIKDNPEVDVVYVVLPNSMHAEYTIRAAKAGKHVLCEKPMANTVADCQAMIDACKAAHRKLMIGYRVRYEPMTQKAIALAQSADDMGVIKQITAEAGFNAGNPDQWRLNRKLAGGGSLMDMGIYAVNAVRYLSGQEPTEVSAVSYSTPGDPRFKEVEETISFELRFASGIVASCLSTYGFNCNRFRVYGTEGWLECGAISGLFRQSVVAIAWPQPPNGALRAGESFRSRDGRFQPVRSQRQRVVNAGRRRAERLESDDGSVRIGGSWQSHQNRITRENSK